jgi:hypothetical protein
VAAWPASSQMPAQIATQQQAQQALGTYPLQGQGVSACFLECCILFTPPHWQQLGQGRHLPKHD